MIFISDPIGNEVILTGKIFDQVSHRRLPKFSLDDFKSVITSPDMMIDNEEDTGWIYYIKKLGELTRIIISAYPVGEYLMTFTCIFNPVKEYVQELIKSGLVLSFNPQGRGALISFNMEI